MSNGELESLIRIVERQEARIAELERGQLGKNNIADLLTRSKDMIKELNQRVNDLEVKLDNLRVQYDHHDHPYKPEPRYGG